MNAFCQTIQLNSLRDDIEAGLQPKGTGVLVG
jgi:hypothetical protein